MVQKLKILSLSLLFFLFSFWGVFKLPYTQHIIQDTVASMGQKSGLIISYKTLDFSLPFCFHCTDLSITTTENMPVASCPSLTFSPILIDLPWNRCTLLYLYAQDLSLNLDNVPKKNTQPAATPAWAFSVLYFSLPSLSYNSTQLPNNKLELSISGRASTQNNGDRAALDIQVTRDDPKAWPKEWCLNAAKKGELVTFDGSCALHGAINTLLFSANDYLSFSGECSLSLSATNFLKKASCKWAISSKSLQHSLGQDVFLEHSFQSRGSLFYEGNNCLNGTIDAAQVKIILQKPLLNTSFVPIKQQSLSLEGQFAAKRLDNGSYRFEMSLPICSVNGSPGSFSISADVSPNQLKNGDLDLKETSGLDDQKTPPDSKTEPSSIAQLQKPSLEPNSASSTGLGIAPEDDVEKNLKAVLSGSFTTPDRTIPILGILTASLGGKSPSGDLTLTSSPFVAAFHFQKNDAENSFVANIRCLNLSSISPDFNRGEAEVFAQFATKGGKKPLTLMVRASDLSIYNTEVQDSTFSFSSTDIIHDCLSMRIDCVGLRKKDFFLNKVQSLLSYTPSNHELAIQEISLLGKQGQLPFNLIGTGTCLLQKKALSFCIDSLEGTLENQTIRLTRPIQIDLQNSILTNASASIRIGRECLITGQWQRPSGNVALSELNVEHLPVHLLSLALDKHISSGTASGFLQYKKTADDIIAKMHFDASKVRYGVIGEEGSELAIGADAHIEKGTLSASLCAAGVGIKDPLFAEGKIPITYTKKAPFFTIEPTSPIQATLRGSVSLSEFLTTWIPQHVHIEGTILGELAVSGPLNNLSFHGPVLLRKGRIEISTTAQVLNNIEMDGSATGQTILVDSIRADDEKEGSVTGHGTIGINDDGRFAWDADLTCSQIEVVSLAYAKSLADGKVHLQGDHSTLQIIGNPISKNAIVDLAARFPNSIPEMQITYKDEQATLKTPYTVTLHLGVDGQNGLMIRGKGLSSTWKGNVHIDGEAESLKMQGTLRCTEGSFMLGSKELCITEGTIGVHGNLFTDSKLHVIATITLPDVVASVSLTGSLASPKISIQSPPMKPENEILSLILFNKEYGDISPFESLQLAQTALQLRQTKSPFDLIDKMKESLGIDVLDVNTSNLQTNQSTSGALDPSDTTPLAPQVQNDVSLRVGKYVSQGVAVVVSKDVTSDTNRLGLEAHIAKEVTASAEIGDDESGVVSLKWKKDY